MAKKVNATADHTVIIPLIAKEILDEQIAKKLA
jgi:deoxyhypusine synthase